MKSYFSFETENLVLQGLGAESVVFYLHILTFCTQKTYFSL